MTVPTQEVNVVDVHELSKWIKREFDRDVDVLRILLDSKYEMRNNSFYEPDLHDIAYWHEHDDGIWDAEDATEFMETGIGFINSVDALLWWLDKYGHMPAGSCLIKVWW